MRVSAEDWLTSVDTQFRLATQLGDQVIIVATSTGSAFSIWLAQQFPDQIAALLHLSPNYRVRTRLARFLTWPCAHTWVPLLTGGYREWTPISEQQRQFWTTRQPASSLIEMQKVVDWVQDQDLSNITIPLATMYMQNDPTIDPAAAISAHNSWGSAVKRLIRVAPGGDRHPMFSSVTSVRHIETDGVISSSLHSWIISVMSSHLRVDQRDVNESSELAFSEHFTPQQIKRTIYIPQQG